MSEHMHAEILRAIADGKTAQYQSPSGWRDGGTLNPLNFPQYLWRVKPEKQPDFIIARCISLKAALDAGSEFYKSGQILILQKGEPNIVMTFDSETLKLKAIELI